MKTIKVEAVYFGRNVSIFLVSQDILLIVIGYIYYNINCALKCVTTVYEIRINISHFSVNTRTYAILIT